MTMGMLWRFASIAIAFMSGVYFLRYAGKYIHDMPPGIWATDNIVVFGLCILLWVANVFLGAIIWRTILKDFGVRLELSKTLGIYALAQFGKYLPGNVGHHVGRVVLAKAAGIAARATAHSMLNEFLWSVSAASGVALLGLVYFSYETHRVNDISLPILLAVTVFSMLLPWLGVWICNAFLVRFVERFTGGNGIEFPRLYTMLFCSSVYLGSFLIMGLIMDLQAKLIFGATESHVLMLSGIFALSWIAGYVVPGAPAGLGVREAILLAFLTPVYGGSVAVGLSLTLRLTTIAGDGLCFVLALIARHLPNAR